jgi:hypothetical protein
MEICVDAAVASEQPSEQASIIGEAEEQHTCDMCGSIFAKRNQLFKHLRTHGVFPENEVTYVRVGLLGGPSQENGKSVSNIDENAPSELTTQHVSVKVFYISGHCTVSSLFDKFTDTVNRSKAVADISICTTNPPLNDQVLKSISEQLHTDEGLILSNNCFYLIVVAVNGTCTIYRYND